MQRAYAAFFTSQALAQFTDTRALHRKAMSWGDFKKKLAAISALT